MFPPKQEEFIVIEPEKDKKLSKRLEKIFELLEETANIKRDNISDLKGGKLLIKTTSDESSRKLKELDHILECPIKAFSHPTLNQVQGTIYSNFLLDEPTETLLDQWKKFGVIGVYRFTTFQNGEVKPTPRLLLTFKGLNLPSKLNLGWRQYDIRQHIPTPRRCYKCNRIGHSQKICRSSKSCLNCAELFHERPCNNPIKCINCGDPHKANDSSCPRYLLEKEILSIKTLENQSFRNARELARTRNPHLDIPYNNRNTHSQNSTKGYAGAVKSTENSSKVHNGSNTQNKNNLLSKSPTNNSSQDKNNNTVQSKNSDNNTSGEIPPTNPEERVPPKSPKEVPNRKSDDPKSPKGVSNKKTEASKIPKIVPNRKTKDHENAPQSNEKSNKRAHPESSSPENQSKKIPKNDLESLTRALTLDPNFSPPRRGCDYIVDHLGR